MTAPKRLPYPGLRAFHRDESDLFFGREGHIDKMVDRLTETRFLAVLGPSGGGKSSLVKTGLLDALDLGYSSAGSSWCVAYMKPGSDPIRNLAAGLLSAVSMPDEPVDADMLAALLGRGPRSIAEWAGNGNLPEGYSLLILADQFEELFRYGDYAGREEAEAFVKLLLEASRTAALPLYVCITMRSEFLGACSMIPGLAEAINDGLYLTPRLSREQCREAIVGPAGVCGFDVEPDLVNKILNDMAAMAPWSDDAEDTPQRRLSQRADQLPLMQHVLNRMWLATSAGGGAERPLLTRRDYEALGGLRGALDIHGDEILAALGPGRSRAAEGVFRALTTGVSLESAVRRPCPLGQLASEVQDKREDVMAVIEAFRAPSANFLQPPHTVRLDDTTPIDISHESLIRQWSTLSRWFMAEAQSAATWKDLLASKQRHEAKRGDLLSGLDLAQASAWWQQDQPSREWAQRHGGDYEGVSDYLRRSEEVRDREKVEAEERGWRERRRLKIQLAASVAAIVIVGGLSVTNFVFWRSAQAQATELQREKAGALLTASEREAALRTAELQRQRANVLAGQAETGRLRERDLRTRADQAAAEAQDNARRAADNARRAAASAREADRTRDLLRDQIYRIGDALISSDAGYNVNAAATRDQIVNMFPEILARGARRSAVASQATPQTSATAIRTRVATALVPSLNALDDSLQDQDRLANFDRLYNIYRRAGQTEGAMRTAIEGWQLARQVIEARPWAALSPDERVYILRIGYQMGWLGDTIGESDHGNDAIAAIRRIAANYRPDSPEVLQNARLAMALSDYENLETAMARSREFPLREDLARAHSQRALAYAEAARSSPRTGTGTASARVSGAAARFQHTKLTRNVAIGMRGTQFQAEAGRFCELAEDFYKNHPQDERALIELADCADLHATLNPTSIAAQVRTVQILDEAIARDGGNASLRAAKVVLGSRLITIYRSQMRNALPPEANGCDDTCNAVLTTTIGDMRAVFSLGFVPSNGSQVGVMLNLLDNVDDSAERLRLSNMIAEALQARMVEPHARLLYGEAISRAFMASGQSLRDLGRPEEAERQYRRAAEFRRSNPAPLVPGRHGDIFEQCVVEAELLGWQTDLRMPDEAMVTARALRGVCEHYLDTVVPWNVGLRTLIRQAYSKLLELDLPESDDIVRHAASFVARFGPPANGSSFTLILFQENSGMLGPQRTSLVIDGARPVSGSTVDDFEAQNHNLGWEVTPVSASEFLRRAEARARVVGRPLPDVAREAWAEALATAMREDERMAERPIDQLTVEQLDALYRRASAILNNAPAAVAPADPRDS